MDGCEILHNQTDGCKPVTIWMNHLWTGAGFLPSTVSCHTISYNIDSNIYIYTHNVMSNQVVQHIMSFHTTSNHVMPLWCHITWYNITSCHEISNHSIYHTSLIIAVYQTMTYHKMPYHFISYLTNSYYFNSHIFGHPGLILWVNAVVPIEFAPFSHNSGNSRRYKRNQTPRKGF